MKARVARKVVAVLTAATVFIVLAAGIAMAGNGPAPNAGDGISDGSGLESPFGGGLGGAPNAGDGIPDGSGF
jgi:hypothetical protein